MSFGTKRRGGFRRNLGTEGRGGVEIDTQKMTTITDNPDRVWRSHQGPRIYMSNDEYDSTKKRAAHANLSINKYIRNAALTCAIGPDLVHDLARRVDRVGHKLNNWIAHSGRSGDTTILLEILSEMEQTQNRIPPAGDVPPYNRNNEEARRKHRGWVRGSLDEIAKIKERAELVGLSQSSFVRAVALGASLEARAWILLMCRVQRWLGNLEKVSLAVEHGEVKRKADRIGMRAMKIIHEYGSCQFHHKDVLRDGEEVEG